MDQRRETPKVIPVPCVLNCFIEPSTSLDVLPTDNIGPMTPYEDGYRSEELR